MPLEKDGGRSRFVGSTVQIQWQKRETDKEPQEFDWTLSDDANDEYNRLQGLEESLRKPTGGQFLGATVSDISDKESYRKYKAVWGPRSRKQPREALRNIDDLSSGPEPSEYSEVDDFRRKYEEICGPRIKKQPPTAPVNRAPYLSGDEQASEAARPVIPKASNIKYFGPSRSTIRIRRIRGGLKRRRLQQRLDKKTLAASRRRMLHFMALPKAKQQNIPHTRPKWVRLRPDTRSKLYSPFQTWHRRFAVLNLRNELSMRGRKLPRLGFQQTSKLSMKFLRELMDEDNSLGVRLKWEKFSPRLKMKIWPEIMIKSLQINTGKTLKLIAGTYAQEPFPPPYALSDCVNYVISFFLDNNPRPPAANLVRRIHNSVFGLLRIGPKDYLHISQHSIFLLLSQAEPFMLKRLYKIMTDLSHPLHQNTLMNFATRLAKLGETETALEILQTLKNHGVDFNTSKMLSLCSTVLDRSVRGPDATYLDSDIFEHMLEWGMQPNIITYNVLIKNSVESGSHNTAWQIHDMMIESGIEPDVITYSILLNDSKKRLDSEAIRAVMEIVREKGLKSAHIVTDVLDAIFLLHKQKAREPDQPFEPHAAFSHMMKVYMENFRIEPLDRIIPWISDTLPNVQGQKTPPISQDELEHPPMSTQTLMITAFLYGLPNALAVKQFYDHFRLLISTGDPNIAGFLGTTHIWNSVLLALSKFPNTLSDCTAIIGDMLASGTAVTVDEDPAADQIEPESATGGDLEPPSIDKGYKDNIEISTLQPIVGSTPIQDSLPQHLETQRGRPRRPHIPPKPNVQTWSILLKIFMGQHQTRAAEKVLTMMQEKGVEPNFVTWTTLANGYARQQDTKNTVDVLSRMQRSGVEADVQWLLSMFMVRNRDGLREAMRRTSRTLNPGAEFLDQLQNDMKNLRDHELSQDGAPGEEFILEDLEDAAADGSIDGAVDSSGAWDVDEET